jgi:vacuolar-type H+-ATPase subunit H
MSTEFEKNIERLNKAISEGRHTVREIHEATSDMRQVMKDARAFKVEMEEAFTKGAKQHLDEWMEKYKETIGVATQEAYTHVLAEFDKLSKPLMESFAIMLTKQNELEARLNKAQRRV